jgi:hypothetical protein
VNLAAATALGLSVPESIVKQATKVFGQ